MHLFRVFLAQRINRPPQEATSHFLEVYKELLVYCSPWYWFRPRVEY